MLKHFFNHQERWSKKVSQQANNPSNSTLNATDGVVLVMLMLTLNRFLCINNIGIVLHKFFIVFLAFQELKKSPTSRILFVNFQCNIRVAFLKIFTNHSTVRKLLEFIIGALLTLGTHFLFCFAVLIYYATANEYIYRARIDLFDVKFSAELGLALVLDKTTISYINQLMTHLQIALTILTWKAHPQIKLKRLRKV